MSKDQGLGLADIARLTKKVQIGDEGFIEVRGISAKTALSILQRFPHLIEKAMGANGGRISLADLFGAAPDAMAAVIAAGVGTPTEEAEADAAELPIETQMDILEAIGSVTFRNGFGPFVERIKALAKAPLDAVNSGSSGKVPDMKSPLESKR